MVDIPDIDDVSAFPVTGEPGMTLTDWFAGQALAALIQANITRTQGSAALARNAYEIANAMMAERG